ncbi:MAG: metal-sensitive transcriptional regulator [Oscillochloris sp.]|nr:metal-sensitive transcriptional regulator [Oscillochloris sp.]
MEDRPVRPISATNRDDVMRRLRRIEGQVRGLQRMVEEDRDCRDIVTQITAVRSALTSVNNVVLRCYAHNCLEGEEQPRDRTISELIQLFGENH